MPINEKELNCILFDQLTLLETVEEVAIETKDEKVLRVIAKLKKQIERKLYQQPPLIGGRDRQV